MYAEVHIRCSLYGAVCRLLLLLDVGCKVDFVLVMQDACLFN